MQRIPSSSLSSSSTSFSEIINNVQDLRADETEELLRRAVEFLHRADEGDTASVKAHLEQGNVDSVSINWAFLNAVEDGRAEIVDILVNNPWVDPFTKEQARQYCLTTGNMNLLQSLPPQQEHYPDGINIKLTQAAWQGKDSVIKDMLEQNEVDVDACMQVLQYAEKLKRADIILELRDILNEKGYRYSDLY